MHITFRTLLATVALFALGLASQPSTVSAQPTDCSAGWAALTFEDGPGPDTGEVLDILAEHDALATFFVVGQNVDDDRWGPYTPRAAADGLLHDWSAPEVGILEWTDEPVLTEADAANTVEALPIIIEEAHARGYCFGPLDENGDIVMTEPEPDPVAGTWHLQDELAGGAAEVELVFGEADDVALLGDWDGDGQATPGVFRDGRWFVRQELAGGAADTEFWFGSAGDVPVVGDWNGDGITTPGITRGG